MKNRATWFVFIVVVGAIAVALYYYRQQNTPHELPPPVVSETPPPEPSKPEIRHPLQVTPPAAEVKPLPALGSSDATAKDALTDLLGQQSVKDFFYPENIIRRLVVTIDNLARREVPLRYRPIKPPAGQFLATVGGETFVLSPDNYRRYTPYVRLAEAVDAKKLVAVYVHFYPLFQDAYKELGYPSGYFNDRLIEVIDNLLSAPSVKGPIKLVRPSVMYKFADPELESRSAGQKILIRMGNANAARIKVKLTEIRQELINQEQLRSPSGSSPPQG
jgi:hypothetical protein